MPDERLATLEAVEAAVWQEIGTAVKGRGHPWRTPVLATVNGDVADARTVVLRQWIPEVRRLLIYTDERAGKVKQFSAKPQGMLVCWSPSLSWQLRLRVRLSLEPSGLLVSSLWARAKLTPGAQDYLSPLPPGAPLGDAPPAPDRASRDHFGVINADVLSVDWLELHRDGHRRAVFDDEGARWLQP